LLVFVLFPVFEKASWTKNCGVHRDALLDKYWHGHIGYIFLPFWLFEQQYAQNKPYLFRVLKQAGQVDQRSLNERLVRICNEARAVTEIDVSLINLYESPLQQMRRVGRMNESIEKRKLDEHESQDQGKKTKV
jgi:hypothetical protein